LKPFIGDLIQLVGRLKQTTKKEGNMPTNKHSQKKLLFLEPVKDRSKEELVQAIIRQLERHGVKVKKKRGLNGKDQKNS